MLIKWLTRLPILLISVSFAHVEAQNLDPFWYQDYAARGKPSYMQEDALIGKTFHVMFNRSACSSMRSTALLREPNPDNFGRHHGGLRPLQFRVESITVGTDRQRYFEMQLEDGKQGYIATSHFSVGHPQDGLYLEKGCFFEFPLTELEVHLSRYTEKVRQDKNAAEQMQRAESDRIAKMRAEVEAEELAKRREAEMRARLPAPRIGMTGNQVIEKTSWGRPERVNRTRTAAGTEEQWVFSLREYLYFKNGRLVAIQD